MSIRGFLYYQWYFSQRQMPVSQYYEQNVKYIFVLCYMKLLAFFLVYIMDRYTPEYISVHFTQIYPIHVLCILCHSISVLYNVSVHSIFILLFILYLTSMCFQHLRLCCLVSFNIHQKEKGHETKKNPCNCPDSDDVNHRIPRHHHRSSGRNGC